MTCDCCFTCKWVHSPFERAVVGLVQGLLAINTGIARFRKARYMSTNFPPDEKFSVPSSKGKRNIRVNVYKPSYLAELQARKESERQGKKTKYAVHINLHGSGFVFGSFFESDAEFCRDICKKTGAIVLDCDYAKAPTHPFPAAYEDVCDVVAHVLANEEGHYDISRLTIGGFSSGGTLALTVSATMPQNTFQAVTVFYAMTNMDTEHQKHFLGILKLCFSAYIPHRISRADPRISPHHNPASAFPNKVLLVACEYDLLRGEAIDFVKMLREAGKDAEVLDVPGVDHAWDKTAKDGTDAGNKRLMAYDKTVEVLRAAYKY
ncbi:hypothetical protein FRC09_002824 [Ceratobasidium sp. 395]|nr:hypothetical protein FRC09_002824 [Ceratobasidium sp. 395]